MTFELRFAPNITGETGDSTMCPSCETPRTLAYSDHHGEYGVDCECPRFYPLSVTVSGRWVFIYSL